MKTNQTNPFHHTCKDCRDQTCGRRQLALHVVKALMEDGESFMARIAPENRQYLHLEEGDYLWIKGKVHFEKNWE